MRFNLIEVHGKDVCLFYFIDKTQDMLYNKVKKQK